MAEEKTVEFYKSHAYDCLVQIERLQAELQATNRKIAELQQMKEVPKGKEDKQK